MESKFNNDQLSRFIHRETSLEEDRQILIWLTKNDQGREELRQLYETQKLIDLKSRSKHYNVNEAWADFSNRRLKSTNSKRNLFSQTWIKVAASILILFSVGIGSIETYRFYAESGVTSSKMVQVEVPGGEKSKVILADGTVVWLNSESTLSYDAEDPRSVKLVGEGYFEVTKDPAHPFIVQTASGLNVRVLGTRFNLRCYENEQTVETTLEEGKVELFGKQLQHKVSIVPGEQAVMTDEALNIKKVDTKLFSVWRNNELKFQDITFAELVPRIERWYGVNIQLDPILADHDRFTLTIKTESIRELFAMMQLTSNFNYKINGSQITLISN
ncbi:FecR family protein [Mangrovibacterium sp.]|uniref:FecR family protein n=1 Tax=Mangrovibacterium sp. TaxID=1961364 RepID=UPI0035625210